MDWTQLGIAPTRDKKVITAAYRARVAVTNPEDKPEEFKALRRAYEEALRLAEEPEQARDESPLGLWKEDLRNLYQDFSARIRPDAWRALLRQEVCLALDQKPLAEEALFTFLMEHLYLPQAVWQVLDEVFSLEARREELYDTYPRDFIDYVVMAGIHSGPGLPPELFRPGRDGEACDRYRRLYQEASQPQVPNLESLLSQMRALPERHPYGEALESRLELQNGNTQQALARCRRLAEEYPGDEVLALTWGEVSLHAGAFSQAGDIARSILEQAPDNDQATRILAESLAGQGQYKEAKKRIYRLMDRAGGDQVRLYRLRELLQGWNRSLIPQLEAELAEHPEHNDAALELARCHLQNDQFEEGLKALSAADPQADPYGYHSMAAKLHYSREEYAQALEHFRSVEEFLRGLSPDGTRETEERLEAFPEILQMESSCLMLLNQPEASREKTDQALALAPRNPKILTYAGQYFYAAGECEEAAKVLRQLTDLLPDSVHGYLLLATVLCELRQDRESFDAVNHALALDGGVLYAYALKMQLLLRNGAFEEVHGILDFLEGEGVTDISLDWCRAQLTELEERDEEKALEQYRALARRLEAGEQMDWASQVYYRMAVLLGDRPGADRKALLSLLDRGLAQDEHNQDCLCYKAWLLAREERTEEALEIYTRLEARPSHSIAVERGLAELAYEDLDRKAPEALARYQKLLARQEDPAGCFYAGTCCLRLGKLPEAEAHFRRELELDPADLDGYRGLYRVYADQGRYEEALEQLNLGLSQAAKGTLDPTRLYEDKILIYRRLGQPKEALALVTELERRYGYPDGDSLRYEICCQFGLWEEARRAAAAWSRRPGSAGEGAWAALQLELYLGNLQKVRLRLPLVRWKLSPQDGEGLQRTLAELEGNTRRTVELCSREVFSRPDSDYAYLNLAMALMAAGRREEAVKAAQRAAELLEELLSGYSDSRALYETRYAMALALTGRLPEGRKALEAARQLPLCRFCPYGSCKDAEIYEAAMEEFLGDPDRAMALYTQGQARWPDDTDFAAGLARLRKRGTPHADRH